MNDFVLNLLILHYLYLTDLLNFIASLVCSTDFVRENFFGNTRPASCTNA